MSGSCPALVMKEPVDLESLLAPSVNVDDCASFPHKQANTRWPCMNFLLIPPCSVPHVLVTIVHGSAISLVNPVGCPESWGLLWDGKLGLSRAQTWWVNVALADWMEIHSEIHFFLSDIFIKAVDRELGYFFYLLFFFNMLFLFPLSDRVVIWMPFKVWNDLLATSLPQDNWHPFRDQKDHQLFGSFSFHMEFCFAFLLSMYFISELAVLNRCPSWARLCH